MSEIIKMSDSEPYALIAVCSNISYVWIVCNEVIEQNSGHGCVFKLLHPLVVQAKAHKECAAISVF